MTQDALDHGWAVDQRNNPHLLLAFRAEERIGFPNLLDELAPFLGRNAAGLVFGNVYHRRGLAVGLDCGSRLLVPLAAHLIRVPPIIPDELVTAVEELVYDLGDDGSQVAVTGLKARLVGGEKGVKMP